MRVGLVLATLFGAMVADVYLHNPRGSNNRLNENTAVRNNANRLFDSQVSSHINIFGHSWSFTGLTIICYHVVHPIHVDLPPKLERGV